MGNIVDMPLWCWEKNESAATNLTCLRPTKCLGRRRGYEVRNLRSAVEDGKPQGG